MKLSPELIDAINQRLRRGGNISDDTVSEIIAGLTNDIPINWNFLLIKETSPELSP